MVNLSICANIVSLSGQLVFRTPCFYARCLTDLPILRPLCEHMHVAYATLERLPTQQVC